MKQETPNIRFACMSLMWGWDLPVEKLAAWMGDVKTAGIVIEDGAYFKGGIDITRPAAPR